MVVIGRVLRTGLSSLRDRAAARLAAMRFNPSRGAMFKIKRFRDGDDIGLPSWARHLVIGGFAEQGWNAYDQRQGGKVVASGEWGDYLVLLPDGQIVGPQA